ACVGIAIIGVAGALYRFNEIGCPVDVGAPHETTASAIPIPPGAVKNGALVDHACLLGGEGRNDLKNRSWWIGGLYGPNEHGFGGVIEEFHVIIAPLPSHHHVGVIG